ncbi:MAG: hypothetical protein AB7V04_01560 [Desulfomonilaceae bacterium]
MNFFETDYRMTIRKIFWVIIFSLSVAGTIYGAFFREFLVYDNLEKFEKLKNVGITIKIPGYEGTENKFEVQSQWFTEPEVVNAMTFEGISRYKDGKLTSNYPDLRMLKGRLPCPT